MEITQPCQASGNKAKTGSSRRVGLNRAKVLRAALAIVEADGHRALTIRRLAESLDVEPMTIYWHVESKGAILDGVVATVIAEARMPPLNEPWLDRIAWIARETRRTHRVHPNVFALVLARFSESQDVWAGADALLGVLREKLGKVGARRWLRTLAAYINGFLLSEPRSSGLTKWALTDLDRDRPAIAELLRELEKSADDDFEHGLTIYLDALKREASTPREAPGGNEGDPGPPSE